MPQKKKSQSISAAARGAVAGAARARSNMMFGKPGLETDLTEPYRPASPLQGRPVTSSGTKGKIERRGVAPAAAGKSAFDSNSTPVYSSLANNPKKSAQKNIRDMKASRGRRTGTTPGPNKREKK